MASNVQSDTQTKYKLNLTHIENRFPPIIAAANIYTECINVTPINILFVLTEIQKINP